VKPGPPASATRKLVSQLLLTDSDLRDIVEEFVAALPTRVQELQRAYAALDWDQLATLAHRLKGASGSYGYPDLTGLAARMEQSFRSRQTDEFSSWIAQFNQLIAAAKLGLD
jgi:HPt (histidine-containing phosphotransfer) domain-containing protein